MAMMRTFPSPRLKNARASSRSPAAPPGRSAGGRRKRLADVFGSRLYVEIQRHGLDSERATEPDLIALADRVGSPLVATNEPYFAGPSDFEGHEALLWVAAGG